MERSVFTLTDTKCLKSFYFFIRNISVCFFAIVGRKVREDDFLARACCVRDTPLKIAVKFFIFGLEVVIHFQVDEQRGIESFLEDTRKEVFGHLQRLPVYADEYLGIGSLYLYEVDSFFGILTFYDDIIDRESHESKKITCDREYLFLHIV